MKKYFIGGLLPFLILFGLSYGLIKAADVEIILGTSSAFNVVRGASVAGGTSTLYVGSTTVSIGTTTQSAMLTIAGSSTDTTGGLRVTNSSGTVTLNVRNDGAVFIGTNTSTLSSALYVGSATSGSLGTITAGFLSMGTISANTGLHGTTTVRFLADIFANGTITTGTKFVGDGAGLTGVTATTFSGGGTISAGSTTVSTLTSTGSATVSNNLTAASSTFRADSGSVTVTTRVGIGTSTPSSSYKLQVTDDADLGFVVGSSGSITAKTLTVTGSATVTVALTAASNTFRADSGSVTVTTRVGIGTSTPSSAYRLQVTDDADLGFVVGSSGTITAKTLTVTGSATVTGTLTAAVGAGSRVGIGTTTPSSAYMLQITDSSDLGVVVGSSGSITAKTITATGSMTAANLTSGASPLLAIGTTTPQSLVTIVGSSTAGYGTTTPQSALVTIIGSSSSSNSAILRLANTVSGSTTLYVRNDNFIGFGTDTPGAGTHTSGANNLDVTIAGNLWVTGTKNFLIPHPDPIKKGWLLRHCAVESPTRGDNLYRYKVTISSDGGETSISLPAYWAHLNEEPEVWVSAVGQFAQGYGYVDEVTNTLVVKGEKKGIYNVLLIGTRKDLYAREFDARGVEFVDYEMSELLTRGEGKEPKNIQLINAQNDPNNKTFLDPIGDAFGLAICR